MIGAHYLGTQFGNHFTIDGNHTCCDEFVGLSAAAHAGIGQELVQTYRLIRIDMFLAVLDTLLHTIFGIGVVGRSILMVSTLLIAATLLITATTLLVTAAALLVTATLLIATTTLLVTTTTLLIAATTLLITATLLVTATLIALLLCTGLTLLMFTIGLLVAGTILLTGLIATVCIILLIARTILLTRLVTAVIAIVMRTIAALFGVLLQTGPEAFGAEATFVATVLRTIIALSVNTRALWALSLSVISLIPLSVFR